MLRQLWGRRAAGSHVATAPDLDAHGLCRAGAASAHVQHGRQHPLRSWIANAVERQGASLHHFLRQGTP